VIVAVTSHLLGHARDLPFHARGGSAQRQCRGTPSFPARVPRIELDFILVSEGIEVTDFRVPDVALLGSSPAGVRFPDPRQAPPAARGLGGLTS